MPDYDINRCHDPHAGASVRQSRVLPSVVTQPTPEDLQTAISNVPLWSIRRCVVPEYEALPFPAAHTLPVLDGGGRGDHGHAHRVKGSKCSPWVN